MKLLFKDIPNEEQVLQDITKGADAVLNKLLEGTGEKMDIFELYAAKNTFKIPREAQNITVQEFLDELQKNDNTQTKAHKKKETTIEDVVAEQAERDALLETLYNRISTVKQENERLERKRTRLSSDVNLLRRVQDNVEALESKAGSDVDQMQSLYTTIVKKLQAFHQVVEKTDNCTQDLLNKVYQTRIESVHSTHVRQEQQLQTDPVPSLQNLHQAL
eukprot:TRINITY_DN8084_c0_g1_i1.p1 TRINITY_DN8084_c0_g1~~TRINITY_DN8084_c0_g1_i1.p1  ORF type:complete len:237 (-),score=61.92 TRINITY_DN8084_c0_g1_i1:106-759(-)